MNGKRHIYADCNATTAIAAQVSSSMRVYNEECFGNASSTFHSQGKIASDAIATARTQLAQLLDADITEVIFTSGGTESCLHAFLGVLRYHLSRKNKISASILSAVEHPAVCESATLLEELSGVTKIIVPVDEQGQLNEEVFRQQLEAKPNSLVSIMLANNETGIIFPVAQLCSIAKQHGAVVHCDATQVVGKLPVSFSRLGVDLLSLSAHKFGGPKGVGALLVKKEASWVPVMPGGGQESGRRGGTEAVAQIVGLGAAAKLKSESLTGGLSVQLEEVRGVFESKLRQLLSDVVFHGEQQERLPNTSNVYIPGVNAIAIRAVLADIGIVVSTGSACASSHATASAVLQAIGRTPNECLSVFRVSFGKEHSSEDAKQVAEQIGRLAIEDRAKRKKELEELS